MLEAGTQRVAAYAVILRGREILLSRLAPSIVASETWTLPGGGIEFGEHPVDAVVREVMEETGLGVTVGDPFWIGSATRTTRGEPWQSLRLVYDGSVLPGSPAPRVVEVDGSTVDARWWDVDEVRTGRVPVLPMVVEALSRYRPRKVQRLSSYALVRRPSDAGDEVLLTRLSARGHRPGEWTLPGGGVDHGESPQDAVLREVREETGLRAVVVRLLGVHDTHFEGRAPSGLVEDFHGVHLVFEATVSDGDALQHERGGTTDVAAWHPVSAVLDGSVPTLEVVGAALAMG